MTTTEFQIIERLTRMEEKFDAFLDRATDQNARSDDHEARIRSLEGGSARLLGIGSALALVVGIAGERIVSFTLGS